MARLQQSDGPVSWLLPARCLLGRSRVCTLRLAGPDVSGEHALLRWTQGGWVLTDLHSRNGTYVDGRRIDAGTPVQLDRGASLGFGRPAEFVLQEDGPPRPHAVLLDDTTRAIEPLNGLLALPDPECPEVTVYAQAQAWWLDDAGDTSAATDGRIVATSAGLWRLHLPEELPATRRREPEAPTVAGLTLQFAVAERDTYVELVASVGEHVFDLKARAHHLPLLLLARARLADRHLPAAQQGWIHQDDLLGQLGWEVAHLNLDIHRIRRQFADVGIADAGHIVERRPGTRQVRIGAAQLEIVTIAQRGALTPGSRPVPADRMSPAHRR